MIRVCKFKEVGDTEIGIGIDHVVYFVTHNEGSRIRLSGGDALDVTETFDEVMSIINDAEK